MESECAWTKKAALPVIRGDGRVAASRNKPRAPKRRSYPANYRITNPRGTRAALYNYIEDFEEALAESVDLLIAAGHVSQYQTYTLRQMQKFLGLYQKRSRVQMRDMAIAMRVGHHAEAKDFKKFMEED